MMAVMQNTADAIS